MKDMELDIWERITLVDVISRPEKTTDLSEVRKRLRLLEVLELSEEEVGEVGLKTEGTRITWKDNVSTPITLEDADFEALAAIAKGWQHWRVSKQVDVLAEKLGL